MRRAGPFQAIDELGGTIFEHEDVAYVLERNAQETFTAQLGAPAGNGTALLEFYIAGGRGNVRNLSARGIITDTEPRSVSLGFVIRGSPDGLPARAILLRAAGPALAGFGIASAAVRPQLELYSAANHLLARNSGHGAAPNPADIAATSRLYVSKDGHDDGTMHIRACSRIVDVKVGPATSLFRENEHLGVFIWENVRDVAKGNPHAPIMAFRFADTEIFRRPIPLEEAKQAGLRSPLAPPYLIPDDFFQTLYRRGMDQI